MRLLVNLRENGTGLYYDIYPLISQNVIYNGRSYKEFSEVSNIDGTGFAVFVRISSLPTNAPEYNTSEDFSVSPGTLQYNSVTDTFEGYGDNGWQPLH